MQVTSESLFHFTNSLKNLEGILTNKFQTTYCNEKFDLGIKNISGHFPMISFCDLPLGLIPPHISKYGSYGIGMTKEWGIKKKLNPVLYLEKESIITKDIGSNMNNLLNLFKVLQTLKENTNETNKNELEKLDEDLIANTENYLNIIRYIKNYKGDLKRGNKIHKNYRFYDEREWRYVPEYNSKLLRPSLNEKEYIKYRGNSNMKPLLNEIKLDFNSSDIKYLIVKSEKDIPKLIRTIKTIDNLSKNPNESDILATKIMTLDQLKSDF